LNLKNEGEKKQKQTERKSQEKIFMACHQYSRTPKTIGAKKSTQSSIIRQAQWMQQ